MTSPQAFRLIILTGPDKGRTFTINSPAVIGRGDDNEICIKDGSVSRRHVEVRPVENGVIVSDLGSRNQIIFKKRTTGECRVLAGGEFVLGDVCFKVLAAPPPDPAPPKEPSEQQHALVPTVPNVPIRLSDASKAAELFDPQVQTRRTRRRVLGSMCVVGVVAFIALALGPMLLQEPTQVILDIVLEEDSCKAIAVRGNARVTPQAGYTVTNSSVAEVTVDTPDGFIIKVSGRKTGDTTASGTNLSGGTTILNVVVRAKADALWEISAKPAEERRQIAMYHLGLARDIESHSAYEAMKEYAMSADILGQLEPRPPEYVEAARKEREIEEMIEAKVNEHVETYRLARKAKRIDAAAAELIKIRDLVSDSEDYRHQKAKILFGQLSRKDSQ